MAAGEQRSFQSSATEPTVQYINRTDEEKQSYIKILFERSLFNGFILKQIIYIYISFEQRSF